jgi:hypothetical protein
MDDRALDDSPREYSTLRCLETWIFGSFGRGGRSFQSILKVDGLRHPLAISKNAALKSHSVCFMA